MYNAREQRNTANDLNTYFNNFVEIAILKKEKRKRGVNWSMIDSREQIE